MQRRLTVTTGRWLLRGLCVGLMILLGNMVAHAQTLEERVDRLEKAFAVSENNFRVYWKNGVRLETLDKQIEVRFGGRLNLDMNWYFPGDEMEDAFGNQDDRIFFRRARLYLRGTLYKHVIFKMEYDFAGGDVEFTDVYLGLKDKNPYVGYLYLGKFKAPFGLEELTSSRFVTFQERSLTDAFVLGRELGFRVGNTLLDKRATWSFAFTRPVDPDDTSAIFPVEGSPNDDDLTLRLTGLPWWADNGKRFVHLGFDYSFRMPPDNEIRFRTRPEARLDLDSGMNRFVDTGDLPASSANIFDFEAAMDYGSFSMQGEYMFAILHGSSADINDDVDDMYLYAFYVMASYFLTGEHRPYDRSSGHYDRPKPKKNFLQGGWGAVEVAFRFSMIDLTDAADVNPGMGGKEKNITFGLNWYLNPNTRMTLNYVYGWVDDRLVNGVDLDNDGFGVYMMRFQVDL